MGHSTAPCLPFLLLAICSSIRPFHLIRTLARYGPRRVHVLIHLQWTHQMDIWAIERKKWIRPRREQAMIILRRSIAGLFIEPNIMIIRNCLYIHIPSTSTSHPASRYSDRRVHIQYTQDIRSHSIAFLLSLAQIQIKNTKIYSHRMFYSKLLWPTPKQQERPNSKCKGNSLLSTWTFQRILAFLKYTIQWIITDIWPY